MFRLFFLFLGICPFIWSCSNIDCPLDSVVNMQIGFYHHTNKSKFALSDTLSVFGISGGSSYILYNKAFQVYSIQFSLNPASNTDTLVLRFSNAAQAVRFDTLIVQHSPQAHFESLDCPASIFHRIEKLTHRSSSSNTPLLRIDSLQIAHPKVQYEDVENIKCYLTPAS